jgi:hypothetical protein
MVEKWGTQYPESGIEALSEVNATSRMSEKGNIVVDSSLF